MSLKGMAEARRLKIRNFTGLCSECAGEIYRSPAVLVATHAGDETATMTIVVCETCASRSDLEAIN